MKKKALVLICIVAVLAASAAGIFWVIRSKKTVDIDEQNFPDEIFRTYVSDLYDRNDDGKLDRSEIKAAKNCAPKEMGIRSLEGIEWLTELERLDCYENELEHLDLSKNIKLKYLNAGANPLEELDMSDNPALIELQCFATTLTMLDVHGCSALKTILVNEDMLTVLDLRGCDNLQDYPEGEGIKILR